MFTKHGSLEDVQVLGIKGANERREASLDKFSDFEDYRTEDGYLYARIRAISSRVNKNNDGWPSVELAGGKDIFEQWSKQASENNYNGFTVTADSDREYGFSTFLHKPIFVDHNNSNPKKARGVIVDAKLHVEDQRTASEDDYWSKAASNHLPGTWVELLLEVDAKSFPKLAKAIIEGSEDSSRGIDGFSMGANVEKTKCNICENWAENPDEYCSHVKRKGVKFEKDGHLKKAYEDCYGVQFFEISAVFDPADETALIRDVKHSKTAETFLPDEAPNPDRALAEVTRDVLQGRSNIDEGFVRVVSLLQNDPNGYSHEEAYDAATDWASDIERGVAAGGGDINHPRDYGNRETELTQMGENINPNPIDYQYGPEGSGYVDPTGKDFGPKRVGAPLDEFQHDMTPQNEQLRVPEEVNTLREEHICPICGSDMEDERCDVCGYEDLPEGLDDPDLDKHRELKQQQQEGENPLDVPTPKPLGEFENERDLSTRNPVPIASVTSENKLAGKINPNERPLSQRPGPATNEPNETVISDSNKPVTSALTARDFVEIHNKENNMADKVAAEPVSEEVAADKRVDVTGVGGVADATNEEASKADAQVDPEGKGGTGVEDVEADKTEDVEKEVTTDDSGPTDTFDDNGTDPVQGDSFPGEGVGGSKSGAKVTGDPADPVGLPQERVDVEAKDGWTPELIPTKTWSGTGGNGVTQQVDPTTNETFEKEDLVNLQPSRSGKINLASLRLAETEIKLGLTSPEDKFSRIAELEKIDPKDVETQLAYAQRVAKSLSSKPKRVASTNEKTAGRIPNMKRPAVVPQGKQTTASTLPGERDAALYW